MDLYYFFPQRKSQKNHPQLGFHLGIYIIFEFWIVRGHLGLRNIQKFELFCVVISGAVASRCVYVLAPWHQLFCLVFFTLGVVAPSSLLEVLFSPNLGAMASDKLLLA